jgi:hypothetical protein
VSAWRPFLALLLAMLLATTAHAGTNCREHVATARELAEAADSARRVYAELEKSDAPVALLARAGTDLHKYGLHYSHVAFVVRDHPDGRWTVVHLLNECGTSHSALYAQGLVNFFVDDLVTQDARLAWLSPPVAQRLATMLAAPRGTPLHEPRYNVIARYDSQRTQNSTAWVLDVLAAAELGGTSSRRQAQAEEAAEGFEPDVLHIPYSQRILGGLFSANTDFTDHPVGARLAGEYPVVTVRSIQRHLERRGRVVRTWEWRDGREQAVPGPT